ncbi:hypothetical protein HY495_02020 [Candidatus Woesearchaeota archaeon]|nr:hypothetical protein [Candidatus Woesearchaeota archaeon]
MVNPEYLEQFRNGEVVSQLQLRTAALERLKEDYAKRAADLRRRRVHSSESLTEKLLPEAVPTIFAEVKTAVDTFMGVEDVTPCQLLLGKPACLAQYLAWEKRIILSPLAYSDYLNCFQTLVHEYAHHLLAVIIGSTYGGSEIFEEGFATGLEWKIAPDFSQHHQADKDWFEKMVVKDIASDLWRASSKLKRRLPSSQPDRGIYFDEHKYTFGSSLFVLLEAERGQDIYRQILHGEFKW